MAIFIAKLIQVRAKAQYFALPVRAWNMHGAIIF